MIALRNISLATRLTVVMLSGLALSQGTTVLLSQSERGEALNRTFKAEFLSRTALVAELLESTPPGLQREILRASGTSYSRFWTTDHFPADAQHWRREAYRQLGEPLAAIAGIGAGVAGAGTTPERNGGHALEAVSPGALFWSELPGHGLQFSRTAKFLKLDDAQAMGLSVRLRDGSWLNSVIAKKVMFSFWTSQTLISLGVCALVLSICAILIAGGIARPMRRLAAAAEALGRGEAVPPLPEVGPRDIRQTAVAFNRMRGRLQRFIEDRTRLLAAIGHDLRTPITTLRLRAEFVSDEETRDKMLATLEELRATTEATLSFAREDAVEEPTRSVDVGALVESLCEDLSELGLNVAVVRSTPAICRCRADALRRAVRNLVENAVRYGERARVLVSSRPEAIDILVEDDGPGIPAEAIESVFAPFFRLETSRNRETGGVGLGLSIARNIARHHGGDISLLNTATGLRAVISLPNTDASGVRASIRADGNEETRLKSRLWHAHSLPTPAEPHSQAT